MEDKGEAKYIKAVRRCRYNYELLNLILSDLMPWYETNYDFSTFQVCLLCRVNSDPRPISGILGFTRQVVIAEH